MRLPAGPALPLAALALMTVALSVQVVHLKRERARAAADRQALAASVGLATREFVQGTPLPALPLTTASGAGDDLARQCRPGRPLVAIVVSETCPACGELAALRRRIDGRRAELDVVTVRAGARATTGTPATYSATPAALRDALHLRAVPAVVVTDRRCRIAAAGAGVIAARAVLRDVLGDP